MGARRVRQAGPQNRKLEEASMRFMMLMIPKGYENARPSAMPDPAAVAAMMKYNEDLQKAGVLLGLEGLHPPASGARVSFAGGEAEVTEGPFPNTKETLGGYWMIRVASRDEAIAWAKRCPASANEIIEIRQVQEMADFADPKYGDTAKRGAALGEELGSKAG
jgi:hypothetical protein